MGIVQGVKSVEEFFLGGFFSGDKMHIVNNQDIGIAVFLAKARGGVVLDGADQLISEFFRRDIADV